MKKIALFALATAVALGIVSLAGAANVDTLVTTGSPLTPFSQNKQNEPAIAIDANHPSVIAAGVNDNIDMEACNSGRRHDVSVHSRASAAPVSYFSFDAGKTLDATHLYRVGARGTVWASSATGPGLSAGRRPDRSARCPGTSRTGSSPTAIPASRSARV